MSHIERGTTNIGTLRPVCYTSVVPGDVVDYDFGGLIRLLPIKLPFLGKLDVIAETFFIPYRLYTKALRDNNVSTFSPNSVSLTPQITFPDLSSEAAAFVKPLVAGQTARDGINAIDLAYLANAGATLGYFPTGSPSSMTAGSHSWENRRAQSIPIVEPGSLANAIGFPVGYFNGASLTADARSFYGVRAAGYLDIVRNYYLNMQVAMAPLSAPDLAHDFDDKNIFGNPTQITGVVPKRGPAFPLRLNTIANSALDSLIEDIYYNGAGFKVRRSLPASSAHADLLSLENLCSRDALLFCRPLTPFYQESWIDQQRYSAGPGSVSVSVDSDSVLVSSIRSGSKVLKFQELSVAGGYRYDDFLGVQFGTSVLRDATVPVYLSSFRSVITSNPLLQTAPGKSASGVGDGLGSIGGSADGTLLGKKRTYRFSEFGELVTILSIRPVQDYFAGIDPMLEKLTLNSLYYPSLDRLGFQPLFARNVSGDPFSSVSVPAKYNPAALPDITSNLSYEVPTSARPASLWNATLGYQPAFSEYTTCSNRLSGDLVTGFRAWALPRSYAPTSAEPAFTAPTVDQVDDFIDAFGNNAFLWGEWLTGNSAVVDYNQLRAPFSSPYTLPFLWNYLFDDTAAWAHNIIYELAFNIDIRREKSKLNMPSFGL